MVLAGAGSAASGHPAKVSASAFSLAKVGMGPAAVAKAKAYLRSIGVDPRTVVIQAGVHNYAGAKCPGKRWTCSTATRVLQAGSDNVFQCSGSSGPISQSNAGGAQSCSITQTGGGSNNATCTEHTDSATATQSCVITQSGRSNVANVNQQNGSNGSTEAANQTATVNQTGTGAAGSNRATITQTIAQDASGALTLVQNGWSRTDLNQLSSGTGTNNGNVTQRLTQNASGGTSQSQDTAAGAMGDCDPGQGPANPNLCANVSQIGSGGDNTNSLFQKVIESGKTTRVATQAQGSSSGGLDGKVHQATGSSAANYNQAYQHKIQSLTGASGSSQTQFDPAFCCGAGSQDGGSSLNQESIGQGFSQSASQSNALQSGDVIGNSRTPIGSCSITQDASNNAGSTTNSASEGPPSCPFLLLETSCNNGVEGGGCTAFAPVTTPPSTGTPSSSLVKCVRNVSTEENVCGTGTLITGAGQTITYQLTYSNTGTGTAHAVTLFDSPPSGFTTTSCTGGCQSAVEGPGVFWSLGDVPAGETRTVSLTGTIGCANTSNTAGGADQENEEFSSNAATTSNGCIN